MNKLKKIISKLSEQQIFSLRFSPKKYWNRRATGNELPAVMSKPDMDGIERAKMSELLNEFPDVRSILDFGCGTGRFFPLLKSKFEEVWATDFNSEMLKRAQENNGDGIRFCKVNELKLVDMVFCFTVLLHIVSNKEWSATLRRLMRSSGKYLFICDGFKKRQILLGRHNKVRKLESYLKKIGQFQWCKFYPDYVNGLDVLVIRKNE